MKKRGVKIAPEIKKQILHEIQGGRSIKEVAEEYSISTVSIYAWLKKDAEDGGNTKASAAEIRKLKKEKQDLIQIIGSLTVVVDRLKKKDKQ